jgi:DNA-binding response OmpR family regulator
MTGFEAVPLIREIPALARVPILAVSASAHNMDAEHSRRFGCDGFLPKPVDAEELFSALGQHLHLEWQTEAQPLGPAAGAVPSAPVEPARLIPPPRAELEQIYELARFGNMERVRERAHGLRQLSEQYQPFAQELLRLAEAFDDEAIARLAQKYL